MNKPRQSRRPEDSRYRAGLLAILLGGFLLRLSIDVWIPTQPVSDFVGYFHRAIRIATLGRDVSREGLAATDHPPAYPIALSLAVRFAPADRALSAAKAANALLALVAAALAAALARRLWGETAALWTAALFCFFPRSLLMSDLTASENLFAPLLVLFLLLAARRWAGNSSIGFAAAAGVAIGLLTLTRSVAYLLPVVWLVGVLAGSDRRPRAVAAELLILIAAEHGVLLPWGIHNARATGSFTFLSTVGGVGLYIGNNPHATGYWYDWAAELESLHPGVGASGPVAVDDAARQEALAWIHSNPGRAAALYARKLRIILTDDQFVAAFTIFGEGISPPNPPADVLPGHHPLKSHPAAVRLVLRSAGLLLALAALGGLLVLVARARSGSLADRALAAGFAALALYFPIVSAAIAVNGRYRWPIEDAVMPLAGLWLARRTESPRAAAGRRADTMPADPGEVDAWKRSESSSSSRSRASSATSPGRC